MVKVIGLVFLDEIMNAHGISHLITHFAGMFKLDIRKRHLTINQVYSYQYLDI